MAFGSPRSCAALAYAASQTMKMNSHAPDRIGEKRPNLIGRCVFEHIEGADPHHRIGVRTARLAPNQYFLKGRLHGSGVIAVLTICEQPIRKRLPEEGVVFSRLRRTIGRPTTSQVDAFGREKAQLASRGQREGMDIKICVTIISSSHYRRWR
jgi:hypothetical protein